MKTKKETEIETNMRMERVRMKMRMEARHNVKKRHQNKLATRLTVLTHMLTRNNVVNSRKRNKG